VFFTLDKLGRKASNRKNMSQYAILNFEDKIDNFTQHGSADSTISGLTARYEGRKQNRGLKKKIYGLNSVTEYRCVTENPVGLTTDVMRIGEIRTACNAAKKIYAVMHGDPRQPTKCFTNTVGSTSGVVDLATSQQMAAFLGRAITSSNAKSKIALVMCYGARCSNYRSANVNHMGLIGSADLSSSFAYNLFYHLVSTFAYQGQLTAVTGKIQHDSNTGKALVEHEEMIDLNMDSAELGKLKRDAMKQAVGGTLLPLNEQDKTYKQNYDAWKSSDAGSRLISDANAARQAASAKGSALKGDMREKYGKFLYAYNKGKLTIASKYGNPEGIMKPGTLLYSGPLLMPT
jgi:hypothetical protein